MKDIKKVKHIDVIIGLIIIILLASVALALLIKRENQYYAEKSMKSSSEIAVAQVEIGNAQNSETTEVTEMAAFPVEEEAALLPLYQILGGEKYKAAVLTERKQEDNQLKELYEYWDAYKLDAVEELVRLERLQKISEELKGKNKYYYYGSVDALGRPSGKGLAVYENNTYYFGEWKEGLRHGKGMWLEAAIYTEENADKDLGVLEHSYNGYWSKDLPNGEGQEHFSYDYSVLKEENIRENECFTNVIGGFKDGYYHGEMYLITTDENGKSKEWSGICEKGVWVPLIEGQTTVAVFADYDKESKEESDYHYIFPEDNKNYGIIGLKK